MNFYGWRICYFTPHVPLHPIGHTLHHLSPFASPVPFYHSCPNLLRIPHFIIHVLLYPTCPTLPKCPTLPQMTHFTPHASINDEENDVLVQNNVQPTNLGRFGHEKYEKSWENFRESCRAQFFILIFKFFYKLTNLTGARQ